MKQHSSSSNATLSNILLIAFAADAVLNLIAEAGDIQVLIWATKPLLMILLCVYLWIHTAAFPSRYRLMYALGLFFSFCGDVLLMLTKNNPASEQLFLLGLISFLLTHLCYIYANTSILNGFKNGYLFSKAWASLPLIVFWLALMALLWQGIPDPLKVPVGVYSFVITTMCLSTINLKRIVPAASFYFLVGGAILFMLSDSLIAFSKFRLQTEAPGIRLAIMVTYIAGQYFIIKAAGHINNLIPSRGYATSTQK